MGLIRARLTARRFKVDGELPEHFREAYRDQLQAYAFQEPPVPQKEEVVGWTHIHDMMNSDFSDFNKWYIDRWILFALRIDKRTLPGAKVKAELNHRCQAWAQERGIERCPSSVRAELKEELESEWIPRQIPKTTMHEVVWDVHNGLLYLSSHSDSAADEFRKRFFRTFGEVANVWSPIEWSSTSMDAILQSQPTVFGRP